MIHTASRNFSEPRPTSPAVARSRPGDEAFATDISDLLIRLALIDAAGSARARRAAGASGERLDQVVVKLGMISEADLAGAYAEHCGVALVMPEDLPERPLPLDHLRTGFLRANKILPIRNDTDGLLVAVTDPFIDGPLEALGYMFEVPVRVAIISPADFDAAFGALYEDREETAKTQHATTSLLGVNANEIDVERLRDIANEAPTIRLVNQIIARAVERRASDIHIEPDRDAVVVRYRVDGFLLADQTVESHLRAALTTRIKIMAALDIAERRLPQDGRIKTVVRGVEIDIRVSSLPTIFGESLVLRILDRTRVELDLARIGLAPSILGDLRRLTEVPNGIILVTGPTGSGKTTTLYAALSHLNRPGTKLFAVEDPIEYQLQGVAQVQVQPQIGLDFPRALRSILRQDPDVIMIGEIRDLETARIAIQASLTGHLVFSTLHTNSAVAAITRMIDIGVEPYLLASTVVGVLAQRLVRRLCLVCARASEEPRHAIAEIRKDRFLHEEAGSASILRSVGCEACRGTGFNGRMVVAELLTIDDDLRAVMTRDVDQRALATSARAKGHRSLYSDGLARVAAGETTLAEVLRVARAT